MLHIKTAAQDQNLSLNPHLFAGNESHEDVIADCCGGNIRTWSVIL